MYVYLYYFLKEKRTLPEFFFLTSKCFTNLWVGRTPQDKIFDLSTNQLEIWHTDRVWKTIQEYGFKFMKKWWLPWIRRPSWILMPFIYYFQNVSSPTVLIKTFRYLTHTMFNPLSKNLSVVFLIFCFVSFLWIFKFMHRQKVWFWQFLPLKS